MIVCASVTIRFIGWFVLSIVSDSTHVCWNYRNVMTTVHATVVVFKVDVVAHKFLSKSWGKFYVTIFVSFKSSKNKITTGVSGKPKNQSKRLSRQSSIYKGK